MISGPPVDHSANGGAARSSVHGDRPAVVLLHGMLADPRMWDLHVRALVGRADVLAPPLPDVDDVEVMSELLLARLPARLVVAGFSLGGHVALAMQRRAPDRVRGMLVVGASGAALDEQQRAATRASIALVRAGGMSGVVNDEQLPRMLSDHAGRGARELVRTMAAQTAPRRFVSQLRAQITRPDALAGAARVRVGVEVAVGDVDASCPPAVARTLASAIPTARFTEVPGAGHSVVLERPEEVMRLLERLLGGERRADG